MALPKVHLEQAEQQDTGHASRPKRRAAPLALADASSVASVESPARALQARLSRSVNGAVQGRWSPRATLAFIVAVCGGFWLAVGLLVWSLLR